MSGVFENGPAPPDRESASPLVMTAVTEALRECDGMRKAEGQVLAADLRARVDSLQELHEGIETLAAGSRNSISPACGKGWPPCSSRERSTRTALAMEVVMLAERSDISEELVRFRSHTEQFAESLAAGGDIGKRLNFLLQEMHREANTIGSKATATEIVHSVLAVKEEIERMREQVQNLA